MASLAELLLADARREALIADCARLLEGHVAGRSGVRGIVLRIALAAARSVRPDVVGRAAQIALPETAAALEPLYREFRAARAADFSRFLQDHPARAVPALLAAADARMARARNKTYIAVYRKLRGSAEAEIRALLPGLASILARHLR